MIKSKGLQFRDRSKIAKLQGMERTITQEFAINYSILKKVLKKAINKIRRAMN